MRHTHRKHKPFPAFSNSAPSLQLLSGGGAIRRCKRKTKSERNSPTRHRDKSNQVAVLSVYQVGLPHSVTLVRVSALFGGFLLLTGFGHLFFLFPPFDRKPLPSLGGYFGPALGILGWGFLVYLDLENPDIAFHACCSLFSWPSRPFLSYSFCPEHNRLGEPSTVHSNQSPRPHQLPRP